MLIKWKSFFSEFIFFDLKESWEVPCILSWSWLKGRLHSPVSIIQFRDAENFNIVMFEELGLLWIQLLVLYIAECFQETVKKPSFRNLSYLLNDSHYFLSIWVIFSPGIPRCSLSTQFTFLSPLFPFLSL